MTRIIVLWVVTAALLTVSCENTPLESSTISRSTASSSTIPPPDAIETQTVDGVTIYGQPYYGGLDQSTPLVALFHQGGSNGRGEYAPIASWLNENGFRAIAWDQRSGGELYGATNRSALNIDESTPAGYCDARSDLQAALDYIVSHRLADKVIVWGSSYSASLVFGLAVENSDAVAGVIAFSPASGGPMVDCRARRWLDNVTAPVYVLRPSSEMERASSLEQRDILIRAGAKFQSVDDGVHGSSMLLDDRTDADMSGVRADVLEWLQGVATN